jgi:hypothetical protein
LRIFAEWAGEKRGISGGDIDLGHHDADQPQPVHALRWLFCLVRLARDAQSSYARLCDPFQLHVDETGSSYPAKITRIGGRVDPVSQSIKVVGEITADAPELTAGMSGRAIIAAPH